MRLFGVLLLLSLVPFIVAHRQRANSILHQETSSCEYTLFMGNDKATGFGAASVSVLADGSTLTTASLPEYIRQSGVTLSVSAGQSLSVAYNSAGTDSTGRYFWLTDANGKTIFQATDSQTDFSLSHTVSCECSYSETCDEVRVRNEWRSLSYCDKQNFISAMKALKTVVADDSTNQTLFEQFASYHTQHAASMPIFSILSWHRVVLMKMENAVRALGGQFSCFTVPFYDMSLDFGKELESTVLAQLGGVKETSCLSEPFADFMNGEECVYRRGTPATASKTQPNVVFLPLTAFWQEMTTNSSLPGQMRFLMRYAHQSLHTMVGGYGGALNSEEAATDPLFWLHHANLDRLWATWHDCFEYDQAGSLAVAEKECDYSATWCKSTDFTAPILGFEDYNLASVWDITTLGYRYPPVLDTWLNFDSNSNTQSTCSWDWFSSSNFASVLSTTSSLPSYRPQVHEDWQRDRVSRLLTAYKEGSGLSASHMAGLRAAMTMECVEGNGAARDLVVIRPILDVMKNSRLCQDTSCKNPCQTLRDGSLTAMEHF